MIDKPDMRTYLGGLILKNPVMTASGTFGYGLEFKDIVDLNRLGGIVVKGVSNTASTGNAPPRIVETACGMLNAIGLENVGIDHFLEKKLPRLENYDTAVFVNIYGKTIEAYASLASKIDAVEAIAGIEVNISCPNVKEGGVAFGVDPRQTYKVIQAVRKNTRKLVIAKLSPNVTDITVIAKSAQEAGADGLSLINTLTGMAVDIRTRKPKLANITGGLSGPAIKPVALRMVWQVVQVVDIPVIGIGGIVTAEDALEFLMVGASAIQVGTANFINPRACTDIVEGLEDFLIHQQIQKLTDVMGSYSY